MPTTVIHCNAYLCRYISKSGDGLCLAPEIDMRDTSCHTYQREEKGDKAMNPRCHREQGKWVSDYHGVLK